MATVFISDIRRESNLSEVNVTNDVISKVSLPINKKNVLLNLNSKAFLAGVDNYNEYDISAVTYSDSLESRERVNYKEAFPDSGIDDQNSVLINLINQYKVGPNKTVSTTHSESSLTDQPAASIKPVIDTTVVTDLISKVEKERNNDLYNIAHLNTLHKLSYPTSLKSVTSLASDVKDTSVLDDPLFSHQQLDDNDVLAARMATTVKPSAGGGKTQEIINTYEFFVNPKIDVPEGLARSNRDAIPPRVLEYLEERTLNHHPCRQLDAHHLPNDVVEEYFLTNSGYEQEMYSELLELNEFNRIIKNAWGIDTVDTQNIHYRPNKKLIDLLDSWMLSRPQYGYVEYVSREDDNDDISLPTYLAKPVLSMITKELENIATVQQNYSYSVATLLDTLVNNSYELTPLLYNLITLTNAVSNSQDDLPICINCEAIRTRFVDGQNLDFILASDSTTPVDTCSYIAGMDTDMLHKVKQCNVLYVHINKVVELYCLLSLLYPQSVINCLGDKPISLKYFYDLSNVRVIVHCPVEVVSDYLLARNVPITAHLINSVDVRRNIPDSYLACSLELIQNLLASNHHLYSSSQDLYRAQCLFLEYNTTPYARNLPTLSFSGRRSLLFLFLSKEVDAKSVMQCKIDNPLVVKSLCTLSNSDRISNYTKYDNIVDLCNDQSWYENEVRGCDAYNPDSLTARNNLRMLLGCYELQSVDILRGKYNQWHDDNNYYRILRRNVCYQLNNGLISALIPYTKGNFVRINSFLVFGVKAKLPMYNLLLSGANFSNYESLGSISTRVARIAEYYQFTSWNWNDNMCRMFVFTHLNINSPHKRIEYKPRISNESICVVGNGVALVHHRYSFTLDNPKIGKHFWYLIFAESKPLDRSTVNSVSMGKFRLRDSRKSNSSKDSKSGEEKTPTAKGDSTRKNTKSEKKRKSIGFCGSKHIRFKDSSDNVSNKIPDNLKSQLSDIDGIGFSDGNVSTDSLFAITNRRSDDYATIFNDFYAISKQSITPIVNKEDLVDALSRIPFHKFLDGHSQNYNDEASLTWSTRILYQTYYTLQYIFKDVHRVPVSEKCGYDALSHYLAEIKLSKQEDLIYDPNGDVGGSNDEEKVNQDIMSSLTKLCNNIARKQYDEELLEDGGVSELDAKSIDSWFSDSIIPLIFIHISNDNQHFYTKLYNINTVEEFNETLVQFGAIILVDQHYYYGRMTNITWCLLHDITNAMCCKEGVIDSKQLSQYSNVSVCNWIMWGLLNQSYNTTPQTVEIVNTHTTLIPTRVPNKVIKITEDNLMFKYIQHWLLYNKNINRAKVASPITCLTAETHSSARGKLFTNKAEYVTDPNETLKVLDCIDNYVYKYNCEGSRQVDMYTYLFDSCIDVQPLEQISQSIHSSKLKLKLNVSKLFDYLSVDLASENNNLVGEYTYTGGSTRHILPKKSSDSMSSADYNNYISDALIVDTIISSRSAYDIYCEFSRYLSNNVVPLFGKQTFDYCYSILTRDAPIYEWISLQGDEGLSLLSRAAEFSKAFDTLPNYLKKFTEILHYLNASSTDPIVSCLCRLVIIPYLRKQYDILDCVKAVITIVVLFSSYCTYDLAVFRNVDSPVYTKDVPLPNPSSFSYNLQASQFHDFMSNADLAINPADYITIQRVCKIVWTDIMFILLLLCLVSQGSDCDVVIQDLCRSYNIYYELVDIQKDKYEFFSMLTSIYVIGQYLLNMSGDLLIDITKGCDLTKISRNITLLFTGENLFDKFDIYLDNNISFVDYTTHSFKISRAILVMYKSVLEVFTRGKRSGERIFSLEEAPAINRFVCTSIAMEIFNIKVGVTSHHTQLENVLLSVDTIGVREALLQCFGKCRVLYGYRSLDVVKIQPNINPTSDLTPVFSAKSSPIVIGPNHPSYNYYGAYGTVTSGLEFDRLYSTNVTMESVVNMTKDVAHFDTSLDICISNSSANNELYDDMVQAEREQYNMIKEKEKEAESQEDNVKGTGSEMAIETVENKDAPNASMDCNDASTSEVKEPHNELPEQIRKYVNQRRKSIFAKLDKLRVRKTHLHSSMVFQQYLGISRINYLGCKVHTVILAWLNIEISVNPVHAVWNALAITDVIWAGRCLADFTSSECIPCYKTLTNDRALLINYQDIPKSGSYCYSPSIEVDTYTLTSVITSIIQHCYNKSRLQQSARYEITVPDQYLFEYINSTTVQIPGSMFAYDSLNLPNVLIFTKNKYCSYHPCNVGNGFSACAVMSSQYNVTLFGLNAKIRSCLPKVWLNVTNNIKGNSYITAFQSARSCEENAKRELVNLDSRFKELANKYSENGIKWIEVYTSFMLYQNLDIVIDYWDVFIDFKIFEHTNYCWLHFLDLERGDDLYKIKNNHPYARGTDLVCAMYDVSSYLNKEDYSSMLFINSLNHHIYQPSLSTFGLLVKYGLQSTHKSMLQMYRRQFKKEFTGNYFTLPFSEGSVRPKYMNMNLLTEKLQNYLREYRKNNSGSVMYSNSIPDVIGAIQIANHGTNQLPISALFESTKRNNYSYETCTLLFNNVLSVHVAGLFNLMLKVYLQHAHDNVELEDTFYDNLFAYAVAPQNTSLKLARTKFTAKEELVPEIAKGQLRDVDLVRFIKLMKVCSLWYSYFKTATADRLSCKSRWSVYAGVDSYIYPDSDSYSGTSYDSFDSYSAVTKSQPYHHRSKSYSGYPDQALHHKRSQSYKRRCDSPHASEWKSTLRRSNGSYYSRICEPGDHSRDIIYPASEHESIRSLSRKSPLIRDDSSEELSIDGSVHGSYGSQRRCCHRSGLTDIDNEFTFPRDLTPAYPPSAYYRGCESKSMVRVPHYSGVNLATDFDVPHSLDPDANFTIHPAWMLTA